MRIYKTLFDSALMNWISLSGGEELDQLDYPPMMDPSDKVSIRLKIYIGAQIYLIEILNGKGRFLNKEITDWMKESKLTLKFQCYSPAVQIGLEFPSEEDEAMFLLKFG